MQAYNHECKVLLGEINIITQLIHWIFSTMRSGYFNFAELWLTKLPIVRYYPI